MATGPADGVEIAQFGLLPSFIGIGLGGYLLCDAVQRARELGAGRVWLHTCSLDHPKALAVYRSAGFEVYDREVVSVERELLDPARRGRGEQDVRPLSAR